MRTEPRVQRDDPDVSAAIRFGLVTAVLVALAVVRAGTLA